MAVGLVLVTAGFQAQPALASQWGSPYGDPPGFCPAGSLLPGSYATLVTNDPQVGSNPEQDTFFGYHASPGYDDWYGRWYGDINGTPGQDSGWQKLFTIPYGSAGHWNFSTWNWQIHGHAKQYIAYYNWTFGGRCGMGRYGAPNPAPYMADVYGNPVLDIYVDAVPPDPPAPRLLAATPTSVTFSWNPVGDRGDGSGADYFVAGLDHYSSWLTVDGGGAAQRADSADPRTLTASALATTDSACVHVIAVDRVGNATSEQVTCAQPAAPPPPAAPLIPPPTAVAGNPLPVGLTGLESWFWLQPAPAPISIDEQIAGVRYRLDLQPLAADWDFGDGTGWADAGFGSAYPAGSEIRHRYRSDSFAGYAVNATIVYSAAWWYRAGRTWAGPYPMPTVIAPAVGLTYPVEQAQPVLAGGP